MEKNETNIIPCGDYILVEKDDKLRKNKHTNDSPFVSSINLLDNLGTVAFSQNQDFPKGTKVYFVGSYEKVIMRGVEYLAIKSSNIVAKVVDEA